MTSISLLILATLASGTAVPAKDLNPTGNTLQGWQEQGKAFHVTKAQAAQGQTGLAISSRDRKGLARTGRVRRVFVVPASSQYLRVSAYAECPRGGRRWQGADKLDILLADADNNIIAKQVRTELGWRPAAYLLPRWKNQARVYRWDVAPHTGKTLQLVMGDLDDRLGSFVHCEGFHFVLGESSPQKQFAQEIVNLAKKHHLPPPLRYQSKHFLALSLAEKNFSRECLRNCELLYDFFFDHFRRKGVSLTQPARKLPVLILETYDSFQTYLDMRISSRVSGVYQRTTNRFVVYDYGTNSGLLAQKKRILDQGSQGKPFARRVYSDTVERLFVEHRGGTNLATTMHEVSHQLAFNSGMMNRQGDIPVWLAEGLACYCEASDHSGWLGIGQPNPQRMPTLALALAGKGELIPLKDLVGSDRWLYGKTTTNRIMSGYAQSWALFRMLMRDQPQKMARFLKLIHSRKAPDHRLTDFCQVFGNDLSALEKQFHRYLATMAQCPS